MYVAPDVTHPHASEQPAPLAERVHSKRPPASARTPVVHDGGALDTIAHLHVSPGATLNATPGRARTVAAAREASTRAAALADRIKGAMTNGRVSGNKGGEKRGREGQGQVTTHTGWQLASS